MPLNNIQNLLYLRRYGDLMKKVKDFMINFVNGFFMAIADSVPGVSGGTVAFILGFYDKFIIALDDLFHGDGKARIRAFNYLIKIGCGWIFGMIIAISFLTRIFDSHIYEMSSLFIGFILFAIPLVIRDEKENLKGKYRNILFAFLGFLFVLIVTYLNKASGNSFNIDNLNIATIIYVFLAAALSISAMILPGISGSTILLIFGLYIPIITKIKMFLHFDFTTIPVLLVFGLGLVIGLLYFTKFLRNCLKKNKSAVIYTILGMMIGSIYSICIGPTTLEEPLQALNLGNFSILYFVIGGIIIIALEKLKDFFKEK